VIAFATGVLMTLAVVAFSAWRVSRMTIAAAIRNLPEPVQRGGRSRLLLGIGGVALGAIMLVAAGSAATPIMLGTSLILISLVPILRRAGLSERLAFTSCGLVLVVSLMLPWSAWEAVFGQMSMNFTTWIVSGLMIVVGTVWVIVYNADVALGVAQRTLGRIPALAPVVRLSLAYPLASRLRTGMTLAMFTLVVFTIVTGSTTSGSFMRAAEDINEFGGGFQVRSETSATAPISNISEKIRANPDLAGNVRAVAEQSVLAVSVSRRGAAGSDDYLARGLDRTFLDRTTFGLGAIASGYSTSAEVWRALRDHPGLAVVDTSIVPRRDDFGFQAAAPALQLHGAYVDESGFSPIRLTIKDPQTGRQAQVTVIGVLKDTAPLEMAGISTSQQTLASAFPGRVSPTIQYYQLTAGADADRVAARLERTFLANGLDAQSIRHVVQDAAAASLTFNRLILAFMGLGLIVGVAALGVISARSVVERRQHIGVLRAVGFRRGTVQASFLLESSIISITAILVGTAHGLILANNIIPDQQ
jgi:putative ABC transport system permease protein